MKIVVLAVLFLTGLIAVAIAAPMEDIYDKVDPETGKNKFTFSFHYFIVFFCVQNYA